MAALARHEVPPVVREAEARDRLARRVRDVRLTVLARVVQHHRASAIGFTRFTYTVQWRLLPAGRPTGLMGSTCVGLHDLERLHTMSENVQNILKR